MNDARAPASGAAELRRASSGGGSRRIVSLEGARGIASLIVILHHFAFAFLPVLRSPVGSGGLRSTPLFVLFNGSGAVVFFFALSGFVLTQRFYARPDGVALAAAVLKRLPRLMVPAGASILLGWFILSHGGSDYRLAASLSQSDWLARFGNAGFPEGFQPSIADALRQSLFVFLIPGDFYYNSNLWTMRTEFYGSLVVFALVLCYRWPRLRGPVAMALLHAVLMVVAWFESPFFMPFIAGSLLAYVATVRALRLPRAAGWLLLAAAVIGFSDDRLLANTAAAIAVLLALLGDTRLSEPLSGRLGLWLGRFSFPIYLVHTLVILSVSSHVYVRLASAGATGAALLIPVLVVTLLGALVASIPLLILDRAWVGWLNRRVKALLPAA